MIGNVKKNQIAFKGEKNSINPKYSLPPNVNGQCRGRLSLCLHEIPWLSDGLSNFDAIHSKIIWWGDAIHSSATLKYVHILCFHLFFQAIKKKKKKPSIFSVSDT